MPQVLVNRPIHPAALERLSQAAEVLTPYTASSVQIWDLLPEIDVFLLCAGYLIGAKEMDHAAHLRVIARHGAGLDEVDIEAATARGIPVVYAPYGPTESTAEHTLLLMLSAARRLPLMERATRDGRFAIRNQFSMIGRELKGKALGVVGFGRIGRRVAEMCRDALQMSVYVFDPYMPSEKVSAWGAFPVESLVALAGLADVLTLHAPLTPDTRHLVSREVLRAMKPDAILINASRGPVVDEAALIEALRERRIGGAGIDVFDSEPPARDNPLFQLDNVVLTPHIASFTEEARRLMGMTVAEDILRVLRGERPEYLANPEVWKG